MQRPPGSHGLSRRGLLGAGAAVGGALLAASLTACTTAPDPLDPNVPDPTGDDDPDVALRRSVLAAEASLIAAYDATLAAHPDLASPLRRFRDHHAAHAQAINVGGVIEVPAAATPKVPDSPRAALRALAAAEAKAAEARAADCLAASRWQLSRELSLIGACEAAHHSLLRAEA